MILKATMIRSRKTSAFTAVELMIAIAIVAVLAAVAVPLTNRVLARGKAADCINNLNNIGSALSMYLAQNNNRFPELAAGKSLALTGESGCGKSTLLHLVAGLDHFDRGEIWVGGKPLSKLDDKGRANLRRTLTGFVFQQFNLVLNLF